jgi:hypothetical protein
MIMATGYKTFIEAKNAAQKKANKCGYSRDVYRCETARVYKWAVDPGRYGTRKVYTVKPELMEQT